MPVLFPGLAQVQWLGAMDNGQAVSNTFYISKPSAGSAPDFAECTQLGADLVAWMATQYRAVATAQYTLTSVIVRQVPDPTDPGVPIEAATLVGLAGTRTGTGTTVPYQLCGLWNLATPNASRRFRGHMFAPPMYYANAMAGGALDNSNAYWTALVALRDKLRGGYVTSRVWTGTALSGYNLVVYSKRAAQLSLPSVANVSFVGVRAKPYWLRSRARGTT